MRKILLLLAIASCIAFTAKTKASSLEEGVHTIQIYSPWNEYYGRMYKGYEHGMMPGQRFTVWRGEKRIGTFVISDVGESISRGKFIPDSPDFYINESIAVGESEISEMIAKEAAQNIEEESLHESESISVSERSLESSLSTTSEDAAKGPEYYEFELVEPATDTSKIVSRIPDEKEYEQADVKISATPEKVEPEVKLYSESAMPVMVESVEESQKNRFWTFHQQVSAGRSLYDLKQYEGAIENFSSALRLSPDNYEVQNLFVAAAIKLGIMESTTEEPATNFGGDAPAVDPVLISKSRNNYGAFLLSKKSYDEALEQFTQALINNPGEPVYYRNRSLALYKLGELQSAIDSAKSAIDLGDEPSKKLLQMLVDALPDSK